MTTDLIEKDKRPFFLRYWITLVLQIVLFIAGLFVIISLNINNGLTAFLVIGLVILAGVWSKLRQDNWIKNQHIIGEISIYNDQIIIDRFSDSTTYEIGKIQQVYIEFDLSNDNSSKPDWPAINFIKIFPFSAEPVKFHFIVLTEVQVDDLLAIRSAWERAGKLRWYE